MTDPQRFLGLDLSQTGTGLVILDGAGAIRRWALVGRKLARGAPVRERLERMIEIASEVLRQVRLEVAACPEQHPLAWVAGVEHYAFGRAHGAFADLGEINGVVKTQLWMACGIEPRAVVASSARKLVCGQGNIKKAAILPLLRGRGLNLEDHNVADAYVIAEALRLLTRRKDDGQDGSEGEGQGGGGGGGGGRGRGSRCAGGDRRGRRGGGRAGGAR